MTQLTEQEINRRLLRVYEMALAAHERKQWRILAEHWKAQNIIFNFSSSQAEMPTDETYLTFIDEYHASIEFGQ